MTARVTLFSSAGSGTPNNCRVQFSCDLPEGQYKLCVESFATATPVTAGFAVSASGIFCQPSWDNSANGERVNLLVAAGSLASTVNKDTIGFRLSGSMKSQTLTIQVRDATGALAANFPAWIMQCVVQPDD